MKLFERLVSRHIQDCLPTALDPHQFAHRADSTTNDTNNLALQSTLNHLEQPGTYVRLLFIDFIPAFDAITPDSLINKLIDLHLLVLQYLPTRPTLSKFADNTTLVRLITGGDEAAYREEVKHLSTWCLANNLSATEHLKKQEGHCRLSKDHSGPCPSSHQQGGDNDLIQIPGSPHYGRADLVGPHRGKSPAQDTLPEDTQKGQTGSEDAGDLQAASQPGTLEAWL